MLPKEQRTGNRDYMWVQRVDTKTLHDLRIL